IMAESSSVIELEASKSGTEPFALDDVDVNAARAMGVPIDDDESREVPSGPDMESDACGWMMNGNDGRWKRVPVDYFKKPDPLHRTGPKFLALALALALASMVVYVGLSFGMFDRLLNWLFR